MYTVRRVVITLLMAVLATLAGCNRPPKAARTATPATASPSTPLTTQGVLQWVVPVLVAHGGTITSLQVVQTSLGSAASAVNASVSAGDNPGAVSWLVVATGDLELQPLGNTVSVSRPAPAPGTFWWIASRAFPHGSMSGAMPAGTSLDLSRLGQVVNLTPAQWKPLERGG